MITDPRATWIVRTAERAAENPHRPTVAGTPEQGAVLTRAKDLVDFARLDGYRPDELIRIIEDLG